MTLLDLVTYLRTNILDDTGGQGVDWTGHTEESYDSYQLRWTNEELVSNINEAINQVYRRASPVEDIITISVDSGKEVYTLPSHVLKILLVRSSEGHELKEESLGNLWDVRDFNLKVGTTSKFVTNYTTNTIRLYPIPEKDQELTLMVYRLPKVKLTWDDYCDSNIELREEFNLPMLNYAAHLCYLKDEANTLDPNRASVFMQLFDREFPFTSSYSTIRKSRTGNRPVKYGGY